MPKRQAIDLHKMQRVDIILVPFDDLTVFHRRRLDRHKFIEPVMGEDESRPDAGRDDAACRLVRGRDPEQDANAGRPD